MPRKVQEYAYIYIHVGRHNSEPDIKYNLIEVELEKSSEEKQTGVKVDCILNFEKHKLKR